VLAEGTRAVAEGDLSPRPIVETNDELGTLTQSFNAMTGQLFEARSAVERNRAALESAKAHLESVLANMSAGVIVLDADGVVVNSNDAVTASCRSTWRCWPAAARPDRGPGSVRRCRHARLLGPERAQSAAAGRARPCAPTGSSRSRSRAVPAPTTTTT
jgi:hypothetical protein